MKKIYLDIMEAALDAYSFEHICSYFSSVKENGITEHGFPRLVSNIGILIANGRKNELKELFTEMMDFCCANVCAAKCCNDFAVKELVFAVRECEESGLFDSSCIVRWREGLLRLDPFQHYTALACNGHKGNWIAYNIASEYMRSYLGLCDADGFIDSQMPSQIEAFDENGMYRDPHEPMLYDLATRAQLCVLLHFGYNGRYSKIIDTLLKRSGLLTLRMQSVTGEIPFGGRSNQFLFNEAYLAAVCEYEAARYFKENNNALAGQFKRAAHIATDSVVYWLKQCNGKKHVKNCFDQNSMFGCEGYAYFDKYMISLASFIYLAFIFANDDIKELDCPAQTGGFALETSSYFHKIFVNCRGYFLEFEKEANKSYDAVGLGRIHKSGAPSAICLSVPFPASPHYVVDNENIKSLSLCGGIEKNGEYVSVSDLEPVLNIGIIEENADCVMVEACYLIENEVLIRERYTVNKDGVDIIISGKDKIFYNLPVFEFDGKNSTAITVNEGCVETVYGGFKCSFETDGRIKDMCESYSNRNGIYHRYVAEGYNNLNVKIKINEV